MSLFPFSNCSSDTESIPGTRCLRRTDRRMEFCSSTATRKRQNETDGRKDYVDQYTRGRINWQNTLMKLIINEKNTMTQRCFKLKKQVSLTPAPGLVYRTTGGELDIYFFLGPNPEQVGVSQYKEDSSSKSLLSSRRQFVSQYTEDHHIHHHHPPGCLPIYRSSWPLLRSSILGSWLPPLSMGI